MSSIKQIERVANKLFPCKVQDGGYGDHKHHYRTVRLIVGKKENPAFETNIKSRIELKKADKKLRAKNPKRKVDVRLKPFIPDVRILYIPNGITQKTLVEMLMPIKENLPENQNIQDDEMGMSTIESDSEELYKTKEIDRQKDVDEIMEDEDEFEENELEEDIDEDDFDEDDSEEEEDDEDDEDFEEDEDDDEFSEEESGITARDKELEKSEKQDSALGDVMNVVQTVADAVTSLTDMVGDISTRLSKVEDNQSADENVKETKKTTKSQTSKKEEGKTK